MRHDTGKTNWSAQSAYGLVSGRHPVDVAGDHLEFRSALGREALKHACHKVLPSNDDHRGDLDRTQKKKKKKKHTFFIASSCSLLSVNSFVRISAKLS